MRLRDLIFSAVLASLSIPVLAQQENKIQSNKDTINNLNEVMVKENRLKLPFSKQNRNIWIIDSEKIKSLPARSVSELLSYVSGVDVRQRGPGGTQADISMDGGTFDETLVLINGIKVSDPQTGHNMMNLPITMEDIDHIEVLRGSASRIYGINALTGAINIVTRSPQKTGVSANLFSGSSFKKDEVSGNTYANYGIHASGTLVQKGASHLLSIAQEAGNGYRYNTAFNNQKVYYQGKLPVGKTDVLDLLAGYTHNNFGANGYYSAPGDKESEETVKTALASVSYTTKLSDNWTMVPRISYRNNVDDYLYIKQTPDKFHNHHQTNVFDAELNNTIQTHIGTFGLGLEARTENINSTNLGKRDRRNAGIFGEYKFEPLERLLINAGAYVNYNSDYGWQAFPGLDAGYNFYGNWRVFANLGTGQRLPTYTDLYYKGPTNIGNDQLQPEKSKYAEGGIKFNDEKLALNASYFIRRIDNFIDWVKAQQTDPWQPQNFSQVNTKGFTLSADYTLKTMETDALSRFRLGASYTNLDPSFKTTLATANFSRYALESLRNQLSGTLNAEFYNLVGVTLTARYNQRINYKDYTVLDTRITFKQKHYSIYADGANLFNVQYIEAGAVPMPGSWFTLGIKAGI
ncbi:TonB-dependent receptor plug domain-containing protein [Pedobacter sp.]|jgi:vitamin B12 transporter|uniref:TonB-dependent receptor plug domain-containing protein n=1 Tax=Pedobacter sp. TaxID=1411316 RepID=UPI002C05A1FC|nr:TonB-dependent receptor [Pedobacter sp.]HWW40318.1 TonB-dependent receptor [Pedobacter sp.]